MNGWKPPRITERTANYARKFANMADAEKLEYFDNIVGAAFRKGYSVRKADERKMRKGMTDYKTMELLAVAVMADQVGKA